MKIEIAKYIETPSLYTRSKGVIRNTFGLDSMYFNYMRANCDFVSLNKIDDMFYQCFVGCKENDMYQIHIETYFDQFLPIV
jgi:hypothetical protein